MNKFSYTISCILLSGFMAACGGSSKNTESSNTNMDENKTAESKLPEYRALDKPQVNLSEFKTDKDGYIILFDGTDMKGWRGYGKDNVPGKWTVDNGAIKFNGSGGGEAQDEDGGDLIFAHKFKNFELELEYKVAKGSNSGIFILAQEIESKDHTLPFN